MTEAIFVSGIEAAWQPEEPKCQPSARIDAAIGHETSLMHVDFIIIGQGIAGSVLAWQLHALGQRVILFDRDTPQTASRVAAGLMSPLSGKRLAVSWRFREFWTSAVAFYRNVERQTATSLFLTNPLVQIMDEPSAALQSARSEYLAPATSLPSSLNAAGAYEITPSARLDVAAFLMATRQFFQSRDAYFTADVDTKSDIRCDEDSVQVVPWDTSAKHLILCQGTDAHHDVWCSHLPFEAAKGEILTVRVPGLDDRRTFRKRVWLTPLGQQHFLVGATFDREHLDHQPTAAGRAQLLEGLHEFLRTSPEVVAQHAALRPIIRGRRPVTGLSDRNARIGYFNGLGSKGALRAPWYAARFASQLTENEPRPGDGLPGHEIVSSRRLTQLAHEKIVSVLRTGDVVVDATVGNGHDTAFLANAVGRTGTVIAIDIQEEALRRARERIAKSGWTHVSFCHGSHAVMHDWVPERYRGQVKAVMFNLGYLPRGDKAIVTRLPSTVTAIRAAGDFLVEGGMMTILAYTGHPHGWDEAQGVEQLLRELSAGQFSVWQSHPQLIQGQPCLFAVTKCVSASPNTC